MMLSLKFCLISLLGMLLLTTSLTEEIYTALKSDSEILIDKAIKQIESAHKSTLHDAYKGSLMMKKSSFQKAVAKKIEIFKQGKIILDACILEQPKNIELRFLRLSIQENAPKILKYNTNLEEDKKLIVSGFKSVTSTVQKHITEYSKNSKILAESDLVN